jgi:hypothetical protein
MRFHPVHTKSDLNPEKILHTYFATVNDNYRIQRSLNSSKWLAFFRTGPRTSKGAFALVGPPVKTKKEAIDQCCEHSLNLPW